MKITPNFNSYEFRQFNKHGFEEVLYPEAWIVSRLDPLCVSLEIIRAAWGKPITIISGYRTGPYNRVVKGRPASQHLEGRAADFEVAGVSAPRVHATVYDLIRKGHLPRVKGLGRYATFTHIDIRVSAWFINWIGGKRRL